MPRIAILRVDDGLVVVDKPPGLASTGRDLDDPDCAQFQVMEALGRRKPVWAVHQLDKDTSGLNLFVLRRSLVAPWAARLGAVGQREVKRYLAICHGELAAERMVDAAIGRRRAPDGRTLPALVSGGKPARTRLLPLAVGGGFSLVEARPATGRTHQVRLHLAAAGHPLVGEALHRDRPCELHARHALHAWALELGPPEGRLEARLAPDLVGLLARLGLEAAGVG